MAESYYGGMTNDLIAGRRRQVAQQQLGGGLYDPRTEIDYGRGVMREAAARASARQAAADEKALKEKSLALQDTYQTGILKNAADKLESDKIYQGGVLNINTEANRIKALEAASTDEYRKAASANQKETMDNTTSANITNAAMNLGGKLFSGLWGYEKTDPATGKKKLGNEAVDWFKSTLSGGEKPGSMSGSAIGDYSDVTPAQAAGWESEGMFPPPATTPTASAPADPIGTPVSQKSTYDMVVDNYDKSVASEGSQPSGQFAEARLGGDTATMNDANPIAPIGQPTAEKGVPAKFEDLPDQSAAEPIAGMGGQGSTATEGTTELPSWTGEAPEWKTPDPYEAPNYEAPTIEPQKPLSLPGFTYDVPYQAPPSINAYTAFKWAQEHGMGLTDKYANWEPGDSEAVNQRRGQEARAAWQQGHDAAHANYNAWAQSQQAAANAAYQQFAASKNAEAKSNYDSRVAKEAEAYNTYWAGEKSKYDTALQEYEHAKEAYYAQDDGGGSGASQGKAKWDYNQGLGGERKQSLVDRSFTRETEPTPPEGFSTGGGFRAPAETVGGYRGAEYNPTGYTAPEQRFSLGGANYEAPSGEDFTYDATPNYEPPAYESPYKFSELYNPTAYEQRPYEAPNYEAGSYGGYEPPNYEAGSYSGGSGGGSFQDDYAGTGGGGGGGASGGWDDDEKIVCTELNRQGYLPDDILQSDAECRRKMIPFDVYVGYLTLFGPVVALMKRSKIFTNIVRPFGVATAHEMASRVNPEVKGTTLGKLVLKAGIPLCRFVGKLAMRALATATGNTMEVA